MIQTLQAASLIHEYNVWTFPVVLGRGKRLFGETAKPFALRLVRSQVLTTGVVMSTYVPGGDIRPGSFASAEPSDTLINGCSSGRGSMSSCPNQFVARSRIRQVWFLRNFTNGQFVPISGMGSWDVKQRTYPGQIARRDVVPGGHFEHRLGPGKFVMRLARYGRGRFSFHEIRNPRATGKKSDRERQNSATQLYDCFRRNGAP